MTSVLHALSWALMVSGGLFVITGGIGVLRMPDFFARMHAAGLTDTLGTILILGGAILQAGLSLAAVKLATILIFLMLTGPTAAYALANAARLGGLRPQGLDDETPAEHDAE